MNDHFEIAHVEDSFAFLRTLADSSVDVVLTDPPYNDIVHGNMRSGSSFKAYVDGGGGPGGVPKVNLPFAPLDQYDFARDLVRVAKRWALAFCAVEDFGRYQDAVGANQWVRGGVWFKPNSMGQLSGDRPAAAYEGIAIMHRPTRKVWNGRGSYGWWQADSDEFPSEEAHYVCNGTRGEAERHPNQKPLRLCLELVAKFTQRGETVLDPFAGSGRIGEACLALGRRYIGLENDPTWVERARARLAALEVPFGAISDVDCLRLCAYQNRAPAAERPAGGSSEKPRGRGRGARPPTPQAS